MSDFSAPGPLLYPSHHAASLKVHCIAWELSLIFSCDRKYAMEPLQMLTKPEKGS